MPLQEKIKETIEKLKQERDELRLQIHLGTAEVKDEWERLEKRWHEIEQKMAAVANATAESSKEVAAALSLVADEISRGYQRIKKQLV